MIKKSKQDKTVGSPHLDRFIQRTMGERMQQVDEEAIAKAIKTLLHEEKNKQLN